MLTLPQFFALAVMSGMMVAFVWGRFRYDIIAVTALLISIGVGIVPFDKAFSGFSDDIVIIVASALLVSAGVSRSGVVPVVMQRIAPDIMNVRMQLFVLVTAVALLSAVIKNIGALAIMLPIAAQFARRSNVSPSNFLMPMAFASLLGGLMTLVGTSPNIVVSRVREQLVGKPFGMFDYTIVGFALTLAGIIFLVLFYWLLPQRTRSDVSIQDAIEIKNYTVEAKITQKSAIAGKPVSDLLRMSNGEVRLLSILRAGDQKMTPLPDAELRADDILLLEGDHESVDRLVSNAGLDLTGKREIAAQKESDGGVVTVEAVVRESSTVVGANAESMRLFEIYGVNLIAVSRKSERLNEKLGKLILRSGDIVVLQARQSVLPDFLRDMGLLPLVERAVLLGNVRRGSIPIVILAAAMVATATGVIPVAVAFFSAAVLMVLFGVIPLRDIYSSIEAPILVMLAALIPISDSLRTTGMTDLIAAGLASFGADLPAFGALALMMIAAMGVTPFLNNAATVLVMAPIAARFADSLGYQPEAFLMAVAIGAGSDFLTPIGHQCNTLVMGPGGYKFSDYPRLGLPLSVVVVLIAVPALMLVWQL